MSGYKVELSNGKSIDVPYGRAKNKKEYISIYGMQAILERVKRTNLMKHYKKMDADVKVIKIICPDGREIEDF